MTKDCIICGKPVTVPIDFDSEIVACESEHCIHVIECSIGLHYSVGYDPAKPGNDYSAKVTYDDGRVINIERQKNG